MIIREEKITNSLLDEVEPLLEETAKETGSLRGEFKVNRLMYIRMSNLGVYVAITVRDSAGSIIGYAGYTVTPHLYYQQYTMAMQDAIHLSKSHRKGFTGVRLFKESERILKEDHNVNLIIQNSTQKIDLSNLFYRLGYKDSDRMFLKELV
jgi:hypothetical protein